MEYLVNNLSRCKIFFATFLLVTSLSFQSWVKADDISDFQIEGMSIGDSLLDFYSKAEIEDALQLTQYPASDKFIIYTFRNEERFEKPFCRKKNLSVRIEIF